MDSFHHNKNRDPAKLEWQVQLGFWPPVVAAEAVNISAGRQTIRIALPLGSWVRISSREVVYMGDNVLAADYDLPGIVAEAVARRMAAG